MRARSATPSAQWAAPLDAATAIELLQRQPAKDAPATALGPAHGHLAQRPQSPLRLLERGSAVQASRSCGAQIARKLGLGDTYRVLLGEGARRLGVSEKDLRALLGRTYQVTRETRTGFVAPGEVGWPPNQSLGRQMGLQMARTIICRPGPGPAIVKIKGTGQAHDHPRVNQQINNRRRPPLPYPLIWDRDFLRTGTPQFGLQAELAEQEFTNLLRMHALSMAVYGQWAPAPIPLDVAPVERVLMAGKEVSLVRARGDRGLWEGHLDYFERDQRDMFDRLRQIDPALVEHASSLPELKAKLAGAPKAEQKALLLAHDLEPAGRSAEALGELYADLVLAERFVAEHPLAQLSMIEAGQYRNNLIEVWYDANVVTDRGEALDELLSQHLSRVGVVYQRPKGAGRARFEDYHSAALAPYRAAVEKVAERALVDIGRAYGMARALGADTRDGFHAKDAIGGEVTDWLDIELLPKGDTPFAPLDDWPSYMGGVEVSIQCLSRLFGLPWETHAKLDRAWQDEARAAVTEVVRAGLEGRLDSVLGSSRKAWKKWVKEEARGAEEGGASLRDALIFSR